MTQLHLDEESIPSTYSIMVTVTLNCNLNSLILIFFYSEKPRTGSKSWLLCFQLWTFGHLPPLNDNNLVYLWGFFLSTTVKIRRFGNCLFHHHKAPNFFNPPPTKLTLQHSKAKIAHQIEEQRIFLPQICGKIGSSRT